MENALSLGVVARLLNSFRVFSITNKFPVINNENVKGHCTKLG
jgi:hypothetical protein